MYVDVYMPDYVKNCLAYSHREENLQGQDITCLPDPFSPENGLCSGRDKKALVGQQKSLECPDDLKVCTCSLPPVCMELGPLTPAPKFQCEINVPGQLHSLAHLLS